MIDVKIHKNLKDALTIFCKQAHEKPEYIVCKTLKKFLEEVSVKSYKETVSSKATKETVAGNKENHNKQ